MSVKPSRAATEAWARLVRTSQGLLDRVEADLKAAGHPPLAWYDVLHELVTAADGKCRQSEIQSRMLLAQYNLCRLIDRMEREALVVRSTCPDDARNNIIALTSAGRRLHAQMWRDYSAAIEANVGQRLTEKEAAVLADLLAKLKDPA